MAENNTEKKESAVPTEEKAAAGGKKRNRGGHNRKKRPTASAEEAAKAVEVKENENHSGKKPRQPKKKQTAPVEEAAKAVEVKENENNSGKKSRQPKKKQTAPMEEAAKAVEVKENENHSGKKPRQPKKKQTAPMEEAAKAVEVKENENHSGKKPRQPKKKQTAPVDDKIARLIESAVVPEKSSCGRRSKKGKSGRGEQTERRASGNTEQQNGRSREGKRRSMTMEGLTCVFSYSGRGFGFATPLGEDGTAAGEDIFIPPNKTMGAMTGDRVTVTMKQERGGNRTEGEVTAILAPACASVTGVLRISDGYAWVEPTTSKVNALIHVPMKDCETLGVGEGTKVEVIPEGMPFFNREVNISVNPRADVPLLDAKGRISQVFGDAKSREANYAAVLHEAGIRTEFPKAVLAEAERSAAEELSVEGRRDLRGKRIFTIDGAGAKDLDDAISLEVTGDGYILGVHIADVSHYVPYGGVVEGEAALRGTSVYFTDKVVPMLPRCLSNGSCSLNAGEDKYALTAEISLDRNGIRRGTRIYKSMIRSVVRGVYSEVNDLFAHGTDSEFYGKYRAVYGDLTLMHGLYEILRDNGTARGVMELEDSEVEILLDETGHPVDIVKRERGDGERLIEQFMLQANMGVAEVLSHRHLPCLYRIHEDPDGEKLRTFGVFAHNLGLSTHGIETAVKSVDLAKAKAEKQENVSRNSRKSNKPVLITEPEREPAGLSPEAKELSLRLMAVLDEARARGIGDIVSSVLLRCMMKAKYTPEVRGHFGLGADRYCHFTSPIRRYPDYFVHTVISAVLEGSGFEELTYRAGSAPVIGALPGSAKFRKAADDRAEMANDCEMRAVTAERAIDDLYKAVYMSDKIGQVFDCVVCSVVRFGVFVRLPNLVEGLVPAAAFGEPIINEERLTLHIPGKTYTLGTPIKVELTEADISTGKLTFRPAES